MTNDEFLASVIVEFKRRYGVPVSNGITERHMATIAAERAFEEAARIVETAKITLDAQSADDPEKRTQALLAQVLRARAVEFGPEPAKRPK